MIFKNKVLNFFFFNILILFLILIFIEFLVRIIYPQNLHGYMGVDIEGVRFLKKNISHHHRLGDNYSKYEFGDNHNRIYPIDNKKFLEDKKIMILGDSFTFGWQLKDKKTYINKLQNVFNSYEFLNMSFPGWGLSDFTKAIDLKCLKYKPKKIIVHLNTDDFNRARISQAYKIKDNVLISNVEEIRRIKVENEKKIKKLTLFKKFEKIFLNKDPMPISEKISLLKEIPGYKFLINNSHFFIIVRNTVYEYLFTKKNMKNKNTQGNNSYFNYKLYWPSPIYKLDNNQKNEALLKGKLNILKMKELANECNSDIYFIYLGWVNFNILEDLNNPTYLFFKYEKNFFKKNEINFYDNTNDLKLVHSNPEKYLLKNDYHPNELGSELIFESLLNEYTKILN